MGDLMASVDRITESATSRLAATMTGVGEAMDFSVEDQHNISELLIVRGIMLTFIRTIFSGRVSVYSHAR